MKMIPIFCGKDCGGNACPLLVEIEGGRALDIHHNPAGGRFIRACRRGFGLVRAHYAPDRLTTPLIRNGPRGSRSFRAATWDEALGMICARLGEIRARCGASSVLCLAGGGSTGALHNTDVLSRRFLNVTGGCTSLSGSYSNGAARAVLPSLLGSRWKASGCDAATLRSAAMIILWGANLLDTRLGSEMPQRLLEAKKRGAQIVVIDPRRTSTVARASTWWIPCRPGTDAALMLATLHVLLGDGLVDRAFVDARAAGFRRLARSVLGEDGSPARTPAWAEEVCGVPESEIRRFARGYAAARPAMLIPGFSIQRVAGGEETYRLTVALQLATGNFGMSGGSTGALNNSLPGPRVGTIDPLVPAGQSRVPVLEWPDLILRGTRGGYPSDIHAVYAAGSNYVNQGGDVHKSVAAFESLDFAVCHDLFLTPTARSCDVVLPAASPLEKEDIGIPWLGNYLLYKPAALAPRPSVRTDWDIFCELADRMGAESRFSGGKSPAQWIETFLKESEIPDHDEFKRTGVYLGLDQQRVGLADFAADPAGHPLDTPSGKVELESESYQRVTGFPAIPTWRGEERDPRYPLRLLTPKRAGATHSQNGDRSSVLTPARHALQMHPTDAARCGIAQGGEARIFNDRGAVHARVHITEEVMPGVASLDEGVWFELDEGGEDRAGSVNLLTGTRGTGPENSCVMHALGVEVTRG
ncbi:MAG: molybdopterin-dependent oxidoreductase [Spirochaetia bacterium]